MLGSELESGLVLGSELESGFVLGSELESGLVLGVAWVIKSATFH